MGKNFINKGLVPLLILAHSIEMKNFLNRLSPFPVLYVQFEWANIKIS